MMDIPVEWLVALGSFGVGVADGLTTHAGLKDPRIEEVNPVWRWLFQRLPPAVSILALALGAFLLSLALHAFLGPIGQTGFLVVHALAPLNNLLVMRKVRAMPPKQ
jgi:hypothetical protein